MLSISNTKRWKCRIAEQIHQFLWHGTSESQTIIMQEGLTSIPVFLTDNPQLAIDYAISDQERTGSPHITLLRIDISQLDPSQLSPDLHHGLFETWEGSLRECDQCIYNAHIPISALKVEEVL